MTKMCEILFRGKEKNSGKWIYGDLRHISDGCGGYILCIVDNTNGRNNDVTGVEVIPETVGMFTRLNDKNRTEIFEEDIVQALTRYGTKHIYPIKYRNGTFWFGNWNWIEFLDRFQFREVIGNIYDNPELLRGDPNDQM